MAIRNFYEHVDVRNIFIFKKKNNKVIKDRIIRDIRTPFEHDNYIEYESKNDTNKTLSVKECLYKIIPYVKDFINNLKKFDPWKIQLTIAINFISSKDNDEECIIHSKSDNTEIMINYEADEVMKEFFKSLKIDIKINIVSFF